MRSYTPDDSGDVKLDVKNVTRMNVPEFLNQFPGKEVPDLDAFIITSADKLTSPRFKGQSTDKSFMTPKGTQALASRRGPNFNLAVVGSGNDEIVLEFHHQSTLVKPSLENMSDLEFDTCQTTIMPFECSYTLAIMDIPENHPPIPTGADNLSVLQANCVYRTLVPAKYPLQLEGLAIPDMNRGIFRTSIAMVC